ncbi:MAG: alpha/beta fold hydrolase [Gammaproteobacteria bacterium]|nr:alpha/beta fold hydrolase [Gammaproteobacteria bacterium]
MSISFQQWGNLDSQEQILFIHGWGMNSGVWADIAQYIEEIYPEKLILSVDLPGYGHSSTYGLNQLGGLYNSQTLAQSLEPLLEGKRTTIIAWSLGGLVAIQLLSHRLSEISKLVLVSSTPMFVQTDDWEGAVEARIFEEFSQSLVKDHQATLRRFLAIQAMGSRTAREDIKTLQTQLFLRGEPDDQALEQGLQILLSEDKRQQLKEIDDIPVYLIAGKQDMLAKYSGQKKLSEQENITLITMASAGHAPFISHPEEFKSNLKKIIAD